MKSISAIYDPSIGAVQAAVRAWLEQHWQGAKTCPLCTHNAWTVHEEVVPLGVPGGRRISPVIPVTCAQCGYTLLLNAVVLGVGLGGERERHS